MFMSAPGESYGGVFKIQNKYSLGIPVFQKSRRQRVSAEMAAYV